MHDPLTEAFALKRPWPKRSRTPGGQRWNYWPTILRVWHVDPERDGSDDSCDWFGSRKPRRLIHPRWHVWHWRIQVPILQDLARWLFSRCSKCGGRFPWGYSPVSDSWSGPGPRWFRGEPHVYHHDCQRPGDKHHAEAATQPQRPAVSDSEVER